MNDLIETNCDTGLQPLNHGQDGRATTWFKAVLLAGMLLFAFYASTHMVAAGDTWVAMACGRHFDHHGVDTVEPFSFNSHKAGPSNETLAEAGFPEWSYGIIRAIHPTGWINQNWLTHLGYYKLATWFGSDGDYAWNALVYWKFGLYFVTVLLVYAAGRVLGVPPLLAAAGACLAMVVGRSFFDIRPAGYSNMLTPAFILILALTMCRHYRWIWLMVPVVVFWANVHGGYLYAFLMLVPFIGINLLLQLPRRWSLCLGLVGLWGVLYLMSHKFVTHEYYLAVQNIIHRGQVEAVSLLSHKFFSILAVLAVIAFALTAVKKVPAGLFYGYHFAVSLLFFVSLFSRFLVAHPANLTPQFKELYAYFVSSSLFSFFMLFLVGVLVICLMAFKKSIFAVLPRRGLYHSMGAAAAAFVLMIVFNPFHLTNLTHTFEISASKHAESWRQVNEWKPAFDFMDKTTTTPNPVGDEEWFAVLCILTLAVLIVWMIGCFLKPRPTTPRRKGAAPPVPVDEGGYCWPKIDLALIVITLLTLYMSIRSRRFIAIAGSGAAPVIGLLIFQAWQMVAARVRLKMHGRREPVDVYYALASGLGISEVHRGRSAEIVQRCVYALVAVGLLGMGITWGQKYHRVYVAPWPTDPTYNSVFMRMTASHLKPIDACDFIRQNKLSGRIFNYWTEGGAVALGQDPDPQTGQIPLKLFMDGRAQAAYNHDKFRLWQTIYSGGPVAQQAKLSGKGLTKDDHRQIAAWIHNELTQRDVWVVLLPVSEQEEIFMKALQASDSWRTAYLDEVQHLLVNRDDARGTALLEKILKGTAAFPNRYTENLTLFAVITENRITDRYAELYPLSKEAFDLNPCRPTAVSLMKLHNSEQVIVDFEHFLTDFVENKETYRQQAGYLERLYIATMTAHFLADRQPAKRQDYKALSADFTREAKAIERRQIW